jgi:isoquinoline 1-oxidoreductase beta subunit
VATVAVPSVSRSFTERLAPQLAAEAPDKTNVEGLVRLPYAIAHRQVRHAPVRSPIPVGFWRSVGHSFNAFFVESFIDECALKAAVDPYAYRRRLLQARGQGRAPVRWPCSMRRPKPVAGMQVR